MAVDRENLKNLLVTHETGPLVFDGSFQDIRLYDSVDGDEWPFVSTEKVVTDFQQLQNSEVPQLDRVRRAAEQILIAATYHSREETEFAEQFGVTGKIPDALRWEHVAHVAIEFLATQPGYLLDPRITEHYPQGSERGITAA